MAGLLSTADAQAGPGVVHRGILQAQIFPAPPSGLLKLGEEERGGRMSSLFFRGLSVFWRFPIPIGSGALLYSLHV